MAQLTWREVSAPQLSTRDLAIASEAVVRGFDRLGQVLAAREEALRKEATDKARISYLAQTDPAKLTEEIGRIATGASNLDRRVNVADVLQGAQEHRSRLIQTSRDYEQLLNEQARAQFGNIQDMYFRAILTGDTELEQRALAEFAASDLGRRAQGLAAVDAGRFRDDRIDNVETNRSNLANEANARAQIAIQERRLALERQEAERRRQQDELMKRAAQVAVGIVQNADPGMDTQTVLQQFRQNNSKLWQTNPELALTIEDNVVKLRNRFLTPTEEQKTAANALGSGALSKTRIATTALQNAGAESSWAVGAQQRAGKHANVTAKELVDRLSEQMPRDTAATLVNQALAKGIPLDVQAGFLDSRPIQDKSPWNFLKFGLANPNNWDILFGAERQFREGMERIAKERESGDATRTQITMERRLAPLATVEQTITALRAKALREMASGRYGQNRPSPATQEALAAAEAEAQRLYQAATTGQIPDPNQPLLDEITGYLDKRRIR